MNSLSRKLGLGLLGLWSLLSIAINPVFAGECNPLETAALESCQDKKVKASGPRLGMFDVPDSFMFADPSFSGGEGLQDYMEIDDTPIILHTSDEVQCVDEIEVKGTLEQMELEEEKAWVIKVTQFNCL
ncbi:MAG TPA: hypothetical protein EYP59_18490 [Thiotrichaceae bacterium]|nr:hypothetical protein [Thiotrichaceae bacterium]